jgi:hypothetical protein
MSDYPQHPSEVLDSLQLELGDIDRDLENGAAAAPEASEDELRVAAVLAREGRFSRVSGEVVDDLLADDDSVDSPLRLRLTAIADEVLEKRRLLEGALEPLLVWKREAMSLDHGELVEQLRRNLPAHVEPPASARLALAETGRVRFDDLAEGEAGRDIIAAWIRTLDLDGATAVAALERSLPELAGAGFSGTDSARQTNAEQFVRGVAERLGVAYPLR